MKRTRSRARAVPSKAALLWCFSLCFLSVCALFTTASSRSDCNLEIRRSSIATRKTQESIIPVRRRLAGPGSYPPRCIGKCGRCTPCRAVHVTVPPGTPVTTEYYPEAWRCKCGNRCYNP